MAALTKQDLTEVLDKAFKANNVNMVTKDDLVANNANLVTKNDLTEALATTRQDIIASVGDQLAAVVDVMATGEELRHQGILLERLENKIDTALETSANSLQNASDIQQHDARLRKLEADSIIVKRTVTLHSRQLRGPNV